MLEAVEDGFELEVDTSDTHSEADQNDELLTLVMKNSFVSKDKDSSSRCKFIKKNCSLN